MLSGIPRRIIDTMFDSLQDSPDCLRCAADKRFLLAWQERENLLQPLLQLFLCYVQLLAGNPLRQEDHAR